MNMCSKASTEKRYSNVQEYLELFLLLEYSFKTKNLKRQYYEAKEKFMELLKKDPELQTFYFPTRDYVSCVSCNIYYPVYLEIKYCIKCFSRKNLVEIKYEIKNRGYSNE